MAPRFDLLLKGGEVIDPGQGIRAVRDVAFRDGMVAAVEPEVSSADARDTLDASGKIVTPGLIDIHGHYFEHVFPHGTAADAVCLPYGVTTTVDAGTSGWMHFDAFKEYILKREKTRLMALINLSALGMYQRYRDGGFGPTIGISGGPQTLLSPDTVGELQDLRYAQVEETVRCILDNPNVILGVKVRIDADVSGEANAIPALERARQVADISGSFVMVHVAQVPIPLAQVLDHLLPGDIVTHVYHSDENSVLDDRGRVRSEVKEAKSRGIVMDAGAGKTKFGMQLTGAAIEQGLLPDTLSTDITRTGRRLGHYLPEVMTIFMALGMSLEQVVAAVTSTAAKAIGQNETLGTLRVGAPGDAAVLGLEDGDFKYDDGLGGEIRAGKRIAPVMTVKGGMLWKPVGQG